MQLDVQALAPPVFGDPFTHLSDTNFLCDMVGMEKAPQEAAGKSNETMQEKALCKLLKCHRNVI